MLINIYNSEMIERFRKASKYQKKAILALFPESMEGHIEIIGNEMKQMMSEAATKLMADCGKAVLCGGSIEARKSMFAAASGTDSNDEAGEKEDKSSKSKSRKVDIL